MNKRQEEFFFYSSFIVHRSSFRREEQGEMSFAILGMGTAVPAATLTQEEALGLARVLCCRTQEQNTWVPLMYTQTAIDTRHFTLPRQLIDDVLAGTQHSGSVFLPTGRLDDAGPTTGQRLRIYAEDAGPLA